MAKVQIFFVGQQVSAALEKILESGFKGKTITFDIPDSELDIDGKFVHVVDWQANIWEKFKKDNNNLGKLPKPKKVVSDLTMPGTYTLYVETEKNKYEGGKITIKAPATPDPTKRVIKTGYVPPHVKVTIKTGNLKSCTAAEDLKGLINQMGKTGSYYKSGDNNFGGWTPKFTGHQAHGDSGTKGWKAYIDEPSKGTGTTWRLYFNCKFDLPTKTLQVEVTDCKDEHLRMEARSGLIQRVVSGPSLDFHVTTLTT